jgi:tRNA modification GTPase
MIHEWLGAGAENDAASNNSARNMPVVQNTAFLLTPPGPAAIAVVRIHGPQVGEFLRKHFSRPVVPGRCIYGILADAQREIDDAIVVLSDQITADLNIHGGTWVVQSVMDLAQREGFSIIDVQTAPLPSLAVDASNVLEEEVLTHLPMARTELGVRMLLAQNQAWDELILQSAKSPERVRVALRAAIIDRSLEYLLNPPKVAIVGPANVGKSTLANQLFAQERSITADIPGTTRDWVGEIANIDGLPVLLVDTPGLRATSDPIEAEAIDRSRAEVTAAALVILVLDATRPLKDEQWELLDHFPEAMRVINKCDRAFAAGMAELKAIRTIATERQGLSELRIAIGTHFCGEFPPVLDRPRCWTGRQKQIVERSIYDLILLNELNHQCTRQ